MTLAQGRGVSWSPSRTTTYSRPPSAKPPRPLARESGGTPACVGGAAAGLGPFAGSKPRFSARLEKGLKALTKRVAEGKLKDRGKAERRAWQQAREGAY